MNMNTRTNANDGLMSSFVAWIRRRYWAWQNVQVTDSTEWDRQYQVGEWDMLNTQSPKLQELARLVTAHGGSVLDIGCGPGLMSKLLLSMPYTGIDISDVAIQEARSNTPNDTHTFECADVWEYLEQAVSAGKKYDVILLNEVLYYIKRYTAFMKKAEKLLTTGGVFVIAIYDNKNHKVWLNVDRKYGTRSIEKTKFSIGEKSYNLAVYRP